MNKKLLGAAALMAMAAVMAAGCGGGDKKPAAPAADAKKGPSGEVSVYTSIYPDIVDKLCKPNVSKAFPGLKVSWFQNGTEKERYGKAQDEDRRRNQSEKDWRGRADGC